MKRADKILGKVENGLPEQSWISRTPTGEVTEVADVQEPRPASAQISVETKQLVNALFARFMAIYGHKFKSTFESEDEIRIAKREWALSVAAYSESELVQAVNYCKENHAWAPSIAEFLEVLRKLTSDLGLPGVRSAYHEACRFADHPLEHSWSHPIVYWSGRSVGWFELRKLTEEETFKLFEYQYQLNVRRVRAGESLEIPNPIALEQKSQVTQATNMLSFAKEHNLDESVACKLLYYLTLPTGSRTRSRQFRQAQQQAESLGISLPTDA
ncbi:MAG TPA: replication protein P [Marinobacterium sp.]|nr:replication protein P [Marinobacterium sp.]